MLEYCGLQGLDISSSSGVRNGDLLSARRLASLLTRTIDGDIVARGQIGPVETNDVG
jgi:hypothetical protein